MDRAQEYQQDPRDKHYDEEGQHQENEDQQQEEGEGNIEEFIEILLEHQKECEINGKYVEAEMAKNRIAELKLNQKHKLMDELNMRQQNDALELEETHILEFNQFNQNWDSRMNEF